MRAGLAKAVVAGVLGIAFAGALGAAAFASSAEAPRSSVSTPTPIPAPGSAGTSVSVTIPGSTTGGGGGGTGGGGGGGSTPTPTATPSAPAGPPPTIPAHPVDTRIELRLDHDSYRPGELMVAKGRGFRAGELVRFVFYPGATVVGDFVAGDKGRVVADITLPTSIKAGHHAVEAFGWQDKRVAAAEFDVNGRAGVGVPNAPWTVWVIGSCAGLGAAIAIAVLGFGKIAGLAAVAGVKVLP